MSLYIKRGRFGEFVAKVYESKQKEELEKWERDENWRLWVMYTRLYPTYTQDTFPEWKAGLKTVPEKQVIRSGRDEDLTDADIKGIIGRLFPEG